METYAHLPLVRWLPRTAAGARLIPFALCLAAALAWLAAWRRLASWCDGWPACALILFPSAYVVLTSSAYFIPQHSSFALLSALAVWLTFAARDARRPVPTALAAGFCAGLAFSNHMLALPLLMMLGLYILLGPRPAPGGPGTLARPLAFAAGAVLGLLPFGLALWLSPGSYAGVSGTVPLGLALRRVWGLTLNSALPGAMGIAPCLFPDGRARLWNAPWANAAFAVAWSAALAALTILCAVRIARSIRAGRRLTLEPPDIITGTIWLTLFSFLFSARSLSHTYRYLLPAAWLFPFMIGILYARAPRRFRRALGVGAILLAGYNLAAAGALMSAWRQPGFAARTAGLHDLKPVLRRLEARGLRHAVASYWLAYRVTYATDGRVLCSQPWNERFRGWPVPYKDRVDAAREVATLTVPGLAFHTRLFESDLAAMGVSARHEDVGPIRLFTEFAQAQPRHGAPLERTRLRATAGPDSSRADWLLDGDLRTGLWLDTPQAAGQWVQFDFGSPAPVCAVALRYAPDRPAPAQSLRVMVHGAGGWQDAVEGPVPQAADPFVFRNGHPVYGESVQTIVFPPVVADGLRLVIHEPALDAAWSLAEVTVFESLASHHPNAEGQTRGTASCPSPSGGLLPNQPRAPAQTAAPAGESVPLADDTAR